MRKFACSIMVSCCVASFAFADDDAVPATQEASNVADKTITVDGRELTLAYEGEAEGDTIQEFIPVTRHWKRGLAWPRFASTPN